MTRFMDKDTGEEFRQVPGFTALEPGMIIIRPTVKQPKWEIENLEDTDLNRSYILHTYHTNLDQAQAIKDCVSCLMDVIMFSGTSEMLPTAQEISLKSAIESARSAMEDK